MVSVGDVARRRIEQIIQILNFLKQVYKLVSHRENLSVVSICLHTSLVC